VAEQRFDVGEVVETPCFDRAVLGSGIQLVCATAKRKTCDCITVLCENTEGRQVCRGPDYKTFVCAACSDKFAGGGGGDGEDGSGMMIVGRIVGFILVAFCREQFYWSAAGRRGRLFRSFTF